MAKGLADSSGQDCRCNASAFEHRRASEIRHGTRTTPGWTSGQVCTVFCRARCRPFSRRFARAGPHGDAASLDSLLKVVVASFGNTYSVPMATPGVCAYLLAVATLELSRAALSPLRTFHDASPLASVMPYLSVAVVGYLKSRWFRAIAEAVFHHNLKRLLDSGFNELSTGNGMPVQHLQQRLALTSINGLATGSGHVEGDYPQVAELANTLLEQLAKAVPSLYWNAECLNQPLANLDQEETASVMIEGVGRCPQRRFGLELGAPLGRSHRHDGPDSCRSHHARVPEGRQLPREYSCAATCSRAALSLLQGRTQREPG